MDSLNLRRKKNEKFNYMVSKKHIKLNAPDMKNLQAVHIDSKTTIFIAPDANPETAKRNYLSKLDKKAV